MNNRNNGASETKNQVVIFHTKFASASVQPRSPQAHLRVLLNNSRRTQIAMLSAMYCVFVSRIDMFQVIVLKARVCPQLTSLLKAQLNVVTLE